MLTVVHSPTKYNLSRNPHHVEITTDNYLEAVNLGLKSKGVFYNLSNAVVNDTLTINWAIGAVTLTFKAATNIALDEIKIKTVGQSNDDYLFELAGILATHATLSPLYIFSASYGRLYLESVNPGTSYILIGSATTVTGASFQNLVTGTSIVINRPKAGYKIKLEIYQETAADSNTFEKIHEFFKEPVDLTIKCDLSEFINIHLSYSLPSFGTWSPFFCSQLAKKFYAKIFEYYGEPSVQQTTTISPSGILLPGGDGYTTIKYDVLKAGFSKVDARNIPDSQISTFYYFYQSFLTRQPREKVISRRQVEYLYFIFPTTLSGNACIRYALYDKYGNVTTSNQHFTSPSVNEGTVWAFPINYPGSVSVASTVVKFSVCVLDVANGNAVISEYFTYTFDDEEKMDEKFIYFTNSDGGLDTMRLFGEMESSVDFESEVAERTWTLTDEKTVGEHETLFISKTNILKAYSGWKTLEEIKYAEELFLSRKKYVYESYTGQVAEIPIIITNKKLGRHKTNQNLFAFVIEYYEDLSSELTEYSYHPIA